MTKKRVTHEEAATPGSPMQGWRGHNSQAWPGLVWSHLVDTCAGLSATAGQLGLLWPREGGCEPPGEEMGVSESWDEFLPAHVKGGREAGRE